MGLTIEAEILALVDVQVTQLHGKGESMLLTAWTS